MNSHYIVRQGDCIESIARCFGFFWRTIWYHPSNSEMRNQRHNPNNLLPGDTVYIPEKREKQESGATEQKHRFLTKGVPSKLRIRLLGDDDEAIADTSYLLKIDGQLFSGETDQNGWLEHTIPPTAKRGKLTVENGVGEFELDLGYLDPPETISGVQARLNNLGFYCGAVDGLWGPMTAAALKSFQLINSIELTSKPDKMTIAVLKKLHGC